MIILLSIVLPILVLASVLVVNTLRLSRQDVYEGGARPQSPDPRDEPEVDFSRAKESFSRALRIPSVSYSDYSRNDVTVFQEFQKFLGERYAHWLKDCEIQYFDVYGMAIRWPGSEGNSRGLPLLYTAHYDVVPVEGQQWAVDPFSALEKDGHIWGRGSLDTKNSLIALMEAAYSLHREGFQPRRDIWFAFGGDEETESSRGAMTMARWFEEQGIRFAWTFDEGGIIARNMIPGVHGSAALVGIEEKGFVNFRFTARSSGGHASTPPERTALGRVSRAVARLEASRQPRKLIPSLRSFFRRTVPYQSVALKIVMANLWLFAPLVKRVLAGGDDSRAMIQSTLAPTMAAGSSKENVLPADAWANINVRILPGENIEKLRRRCIRIIRDPLVEVSIANAAEANDPVSSPETVNASALAGGPGRGSTDRFLRFCADALRFREGFTAALPYLMTGATDSKHYAHLSDHVFRFVPMELDSKELSLIHNPDERISLENFRGMLEFYRYNLKYHETVFQ